MGSRVPIQHYNLGSINSFTGGSLHDLNTIRSRTVDIGRISKADDDAVTEDSLGNNDESNAVDCVHESCRNSIPIHTGLEEDLSSIDSGSGRVLYDVLTIEDVTPIEPARERFQQIIVDHFINEHVVEVVDSESAYHSQSAIEKLDKRKSREVHYEGDPRYALPLMYVANMYETLVNDANVTLASLNGIREKSIGVALEASGGLYRRLAKKFPRKGPCIFKRRELATSLETRTRFPELVIQEEKRVRFVVVNGLDIVEKPNNVPLDDANWFKRLTGRSEVAISPRDYKFYCPRHKYRRAASNSASNIPCLSAQDQLRTPLKHHFRPLPHESQFHLIHQNNQLPNHQSQHDATHFPHCQQCGPPSHISGIMQSPQPPTISQHMHCLHPLTGGSVEGRLHGLPTSPAKFCDECGAPYLRETSKFCSECGSKRLGL